MSNNKPFLRILKLAYKLHKEGAGESTIMCFLNTALAVPADKLPSAAAPVEVIVSEVYNNTLSSGPLRDISLRNLKDQLGLVDKA